MAGDRVMPLVAPRKGEVVPRYLPRRVCTELACETVLSIYNASELCWLHERPTRRSEPLRR
jgi:hypothetical protein